MQGGDTNESYHQNTRRVTALTLAAALVVAVYLNWQYARTGIGVDEEAVNVSAVAVEGEPVVAPVTDGLMTEAEAVSSANKNYGEAQLVSVANDAGAKFLRKPVSSARKLTMKRWTRSRRPSRPRAFPPRRKKVIPSS